MEWEKRKEAKMGRDVTYTLPGPPHNPSAMGGLPL